MSPAPSSPGGAPRATAAPELKRHLLTLVVAVVVLDVVAIAAYELLDLDQRTGTVRSLFLGGWTLATLAVVLPIMSRIRAARLRARRARAAGGGPS